ncbi:MAG: hypothetical protein ACK53Y_04270 [bacterium]
MSKQQQDVVKDKKGRESKYSQKRGFYVHAMKIDIRGCTNSFDGYSENI